MAIIGAVRLSMLSAYNADPGLFLFLRDRDRPALKPNDFIAKLLSNSMET